MSKRDADILLEAILEAINKVLKYTDGMKAEEFMVDDKTIDAVVRNIEVIGEASGKLPEDFKSKYPSVEWIKIKGMRNRLIHEYFGVDVQIIWTVRDEFLPKLKLQLEEIISKLNSSDSDS